MAEIDRKKLTEAEELAIIMKVHGVDEVEGRFILDQEAGRQVSDVIQVKNKVFSWSPTLAPVIRFFARLRNL